MPSQNWKLGLMLCFCVVLSILVGGLYLRHSNYSFQGEFSIPTDDPVNLNLVSVNWTDFWLISENSTSYGEEPAIATDKSGNLHIVWSDKSAIYDGDTYSDIVYRVWNSTTGIWSSTTLISTLSTNDAEAPDIAVDEKGNVHIVWQDRSNVFGAGSAYYDIFYKYWNASTHIWSGHTGEYDLLTPSHPYDCKNPAIGVDINGTVHIVWEDDNDLYGDGANIDIFYRCWNSTTNAWEPIEVVSNESSQSSYEPCIGVDAEKNVYVAWCDNTNLNGSNTDSDIFFKLRNATTGQWSGLVNSTDIIYTSANSYSPSIAIDAQGDVHITWYDSDSSYGAGSDYDILYRYWNCSSRTWGGHVNLNGWDVISETTYSSYYPQIVTGDTGIIYIVWQQYGYLFGTDYHDDIVLRTWNSTTKAWDPVELISSLASRYSYKPDIVVDNTSAVHIVWQEVIDGWDWDIYYRKTITTPPPPTQLEPITPNPTQNLEIDLYWRDIIATDRYYVYRDTAYITSTIGLSPIAVVAETSYTDVVTQNGTFYYAIVAGNEIGNSSVSNCESVVVFSLKQFRRVTITDNSDFPIYAAAGDGSINNPWIIENYYIDGGNRVCITIANTTNYFILRNTTVYGGSDGILLSNSSNGELRNNTARSCKIGVHLINAINNRVINNRVYDNFGEENYNGLGFLLESSHNNWFHVNNAYNNSGNAPYSGNGFMLIDSSYNNFTFNKAFKNFNSNVTYFAIYGGIGFLLLAGSHNNTFSNNIAYQNGGYVSYSAMGCFAVNVGESNKFQHNIFFDHAEPGIYFRNSGNNNFFINNTLYNNRIGLELIGTARAVIKNNSLFSNTNEGAYLWGGFSIVQYNKAWNNSLGFYFVASSGDTVLNNTIYNNTGTGIQTMNSNYLHFYNNTIYNNGGGVNLRNALGCDLIDNYVYNNLNYGITLYDNATQILRNIVVGNDIGVYIGSQNYVSVESNFTSNTITKNRVGIYLLKNYNVSISTNIINDNTEYGIQLAQCNTTKIIDNNISGNNYGIVLLESNGTRLWHNNINDNNEVGVKLENHFNTEMTWNAILNNKKCFQTINETNSLITNNSCHAGPYLFDIPSVINDGKVTLRWDPVSWATHYFIYRLPTITTITFWDLEHLMPYVIIQMNTYTDYPTELGNYTYAVIAYNATHMTDISNNEVTTITGLTSPPDSEPGPGPTHPGLDYLWLILVLIFAGIAAATSVVILKRRQSSQGQRKLIPTVVEPKVATDLTDIQGDLMIYEKIEKLINDKISIPEIKIKGDRVLIQFFSNDFAIIPKDLLTTCLLYTSPSPRDLSTSRMPSSA